jgi:hypothetical protein
MFIFFKKIQLTGSYPTYNESLFFFFFYLLNNKYAVLE